MNTRRRRWAIAAIAVIAIATITAAVITTTATTPTRGGVDPHGALLTQSDFPSGYVVSALDDFDSGPPQPGTVTPVACQRVLDDQFHRNSKQTTLSTIADNERTSGEPRFAQSVASNGESVDEALSVVRECPRHSAENSGVTLTINGSVVDAPPNCPGDAGYVRLTQTQSPSSDGAPTATDYLMGFLHSGRVVSTLTQVTATDSDADTRLFCTLVSSARDRLKS